MEFEKVVNRVFAVSLSLGVLSGLAGVYFYQLGTNKTDVIANIFSFVATVGVLFSIILKVAKFDKLPEAPTHQPSSDDHTDYRHGDNSSLAFSAPEAHPDDPNAQALLQAKPGSGYHLSEGDH